MKNIFESSVVEELKERINQLDENSKANWGKMSVDQMLAHCNVTYEMAFTDLHPKPNAFLQFILKLFVKNMVVSEKPYKKGAQTAPAFLITGKKDFEKEKSRLLDYLQKTMDLGEGYFEGKESNSFGKLKAWEWNNMFYKHLDHHLTQFGV